MSNDYCCVPGCKSLRKKHPDVSFHLFPKKGTHKVEVKTKFGVTQLITAWIMRLQIGKKVNSRTVVCSLHFTENDYFHGSENKTRKHLKRNAIPSTNVPQRKHDKQIQDSDRMVRMRKRIERQNIAQSDHEDVTHDVELGENTYTEEEREIADTLITLLNNQPEYTGPKTLRDFAIQVNTPQKLTVVHLINTESALNSFTHSFTGLQNFDILNFILNSIDLVYSDNRVHKLSIKERVILCLIKLKCDLSFAILSLLFGISPSLCIMYFTHMCKIISAVLKPAIVFPTKNEIDNNMPIYFQEFRDTQIVLDCTEIFVQKPKCLCCRIRFYSHYKSSQTVKFMTGVTPAGLISFLSKPYGGRASDKIIFEQSEIIQKLEPGCAIMVDKGFLIDDLCNKFNIKLYRPPFLKNKLQLEASEANFNKKIAAARVHIERCNQRIKSFKILSGKLQWSLVKHIKDIFLIACAITNLSSPILSDDKFIK